jgi:hypothetical protein
MEEQIKLLKKYKITNYVIENGKLIINQNVDLSSLKTIEANFLKEIIINGWLNLSSLTTVSEKFLQNTTVNGGLYLWSLTTAPEKFLQNTTLNGWLNLSSLTTVTEGFLENTTVNSWLDLNSLNNFPEGFLENTKVKNKLWIGTNPPSQNLDINSESDFPIPPLYNIGSDIYCGNRCRINLKGAIEKYPNKQIVYYC